MSTHQNSPFGLNSPTPNRQEGDGLGDVSPESGRQEPEFKPYACLDCGEQYAHYGDNIMDVVSYCPNCAPKHQPPEPPTTKYEVPAQTHVEEVKKLDEGQKHRCVFCRTKYIPDNLYAPFICPNCEHLRPEPNPQFQVITDLANEMYLMGLNHGTSRVIAYLKGRLGDDNPIWLDVSARFFHEGGSDE